MVLRDGFLVAEVEAGGSHVLAFSVHMPGPSPCVKTAHRLYGRVSAYRTAHPQGHLPQTLRWRGDQEAPFQCDGTFRPNDDPRQVESVVFRYPAAAASGALSSQGVFLE